MNIGTHLVNNFDSNTQNNVRVEQNKNKTAVDSAKTKLSEFKEGSVFKGEILDIKGDRATISLESQETLMAKMKEGVELNVGDLLLFQVEENTSSQVMIKPLFDSLYSAQTQTLEKVLGGAGLSPTEKNFTAAKELMEAGMPVDKGSIVKVLSQSMKFPETPMSTLVALNKMNIPVNEANIAQYERYQNLNHALTGDIADTAKVMSDFVNQLPTAMDGSEVLSFAQDVISIFLDEDSSSILQDTESLQGEVNLHNLSQTKENELQKAVSQGEDNLQQVTKMEQSSSQVELELVQGEGKANTLEKGLANHVDTFNSESQPGIDRQKEGALKDDVISTNSNVNSEAMDSNTIDDKPMELRQQVTNMLQNAGLSDEETKALLRDARIDAKAMQQLADSKSVADILKNITESVSNSQLDSEGTKQLLKSDGFMKLFREMIEENWALDPKQMKSPKEIDELYQKIAKQSQSFEQMLSAKGGDTQSFQQGSQNMRQNMSFMEQVNQQMIYAQMPLKLSNQQANSELYVYADKRRLVEKKDGISVMLHLDMDHLGTTDVKVTLTGKNVNARFYFNDQESVDIVVENMEQLEKQLRDRGFTLSNEVVKRQPADSVNQVVNEIIDENAEKSVKRYTFDVKM